VLRKQLEIELWRYAGQDAKQECDAPKRPKDITTLKKQMW